MTGLLPIDEACKLIVPSLWGVYERERDNARGVLRQLELRFASLDQKRRLAPYKDARAALTTRIRGGLKSNEFALFARLAGSLKLQRIPASAIDGLEFDYEKRTATADGLPPLYDLHIRLPAAAPVWSKPPSQKDIEDTLLNILETAPTSSGEKLEKSLWKGLGEGMTRERARKAIKRWAPQTVKRPGRPRKKNSPK